MIEQDSPSQRINDNSHHYSSFQYETNEQRNRKKAQKKRIFLGIMILCIPLLFSFTFIILNQTHKLHYPTLNEVSVNPYIYQYLNGTISFLDIEGNIRVYDNRKNQLAFVGKYILKQSNSKFLTNSWDNQLIMNNEDVAQLKWKSTNEVLNLVQIDDIEYLDDLEINNCSPSQSYPIDGDTYLLSCYKNLFLMNLQTQIKSANFQDFNSEGVVLVKQSKKENILNIIFTTKSQTTTNEIMSIYEYNIQDTEFKLGPKLIYQGEHQIKPLKDVIIQTDNIILVFPQTISNYKKVANTQQEYQFDLELVDKQTLSITKGSLSQCFEMENNIIVCYDQNSNSLLQITEWSVSNSLQLESTSFQNIKQGKQNDLFVLTQESLLRITIQPLAISETYTFEKNGLNAKIFDLIVIKN